MQPFRKTYQLFKCIRSQKIIAVQKIYILSMRIFQAGIPCIRQSAVLFMDNCDPVVRRRIFITYFSAFISRTVIYKNDLQLLICLCKNTFTLYTGTTTEIKLLTAGMVIYSPFFIFQAYSSEMLLPL